MKFMEKVHYRALLTDITRCYSEKGAWTRRVTKKTAKEIGKDEENAIFLDMVLINFDRHSLYKLDIPAGSPQRKVLDEFVREYESIQRKSKRGKTKVKKIKARYDEASNIEEKIPDAIDYIALAVREGIEVRKEREALKNKTLEKLESVL